MVWRSLKSKVRNGQETSVLVWFTFLSMIFFFFNDFQMLSHAGIFLLGHNQVVLKRHPGTQKNLCQVSRFICNWS